MKTLGLLLLWVLICATPPAHGQAETLRIATFNTELSRKGPGLLLRDVTRGSDPQLRAVVAVIHACDPDILVLQGFDWDLEQRALTGFVELLKAAGSAYDHMFTARPNSGVATDLDLNGDGVRHGPADAQGFGHFTGARGLAVLSKFPIQTEALIDLTALLWRDAPDAQLPTYPDGQPFPSQEAWDIQRLPSTNHWAVPITLPGGTQLTLLTFQAGPPVFDGPEDRNGLRNSDEISLIRHMLNRHLDTLHAGPAVVVGGANLDPDRGAGRRATIQQLLRHPRLQDPRPRSPYSGTDTVDWPKVGKMRVDYILPDTALTVRDAGVLWPDTPAHPAATASRHRLVWIDISLP